MSTIDRSSDDESQASQLLLAMLNPENANWKTGDMHRIRPGNDANLTRTNSPSRPSSSLQYDFHGLGQTQTQYLDEEMDLNESSQKENIETAKEEHRKMSATVASNTPRTGLSSYDGTKSKSIAVKAVSFQSPQKKSTAPPTWDNSVQRQPTRCAATSNISRRHVASPVSSQDSFGVLEQDPSQQFLATSKQFNVPLSELPKVVLPHVIVPSIRSSHSYTYSRHQQHLYGRSRSPPEGTVLVESTPSASGGSQSQSYPDVQHSEDMHTEVMPDLPSEQSQHIESSRPANDAQNPAHHPIEECLSDAPSSFYADHHDESLPSTALAPTQPSTQLENNDSMDVDPVHPFDAVVHETTPYTGNSSTDATNTRSLFSMVDPKKRYRYQHLIHPQNQPPVVITSSVQTEDKLPSTSTAHRSPLPNLAVSPPHSQTLVKTRSSLNEESRHPGQQPSSPPPTNNLHEPLRREETGSHGIDVVPYLEPRQDDVLGKKRSMAEESSRRSIKGSRSENIVENINVQGGIARSLGDYEDKEDASRSGLLSLGGKRHTAIVSKGKETLLHDHDLGKRPDSRQEKRSSAGPSNEEATLIPPIPHFDTPAPTSNVRITRASAALAMYRPPGTVQSWQSGVVPSSIPNESTSNDGVTSCARATGSKKGKGTASTTRVRPKRTPAVFTKRTRMHAESNVEHSFLTSDDEPLPQPGNYESDSTEPADDMDPDFEGTASRKRKRSGPSVKSTTKPKTSKKIKKAASSTPSTRQPNRLRSMTSTSRTSDVAPTRVFALWKQDSCYYSGSVYADAGGGMYEVYFDDRSKGLVHIDQMRVLDLRVNDDVMIPNIMRGFKVSTVDKLASSQLVGVSLDEGIKEMGLVLLRIAAKTISAAWHDRTLSRHSIVPTIKSDPSRASPAPSGVSLTTVPRRPGRCHVFEKTAFVVSVSYNEGNREREKENILSRIKNNGGVIVSDWQDVLNMQGTYSMHNNRWVIRKEEARWIGTESIARIFLVADHPSFKPKFLLALALGVPCLKVEWLYDTVTSGEEKNWLAYMLGQGFSEMLSTQISQQVDINWGTSIHHLTDIMENRVPCKLFTGKSILCVGDVVPKMKSKKFSDEKAQEAHNAITRIILAMGADRVEAVTDIDHASAPLDEFDYVVIKKVEHYSLEFGMVPNKTVHWNWVKECLVSSRLLPQPEWELESQEA